MCSVRNCIVFVIFHCVISTLRADRIPGVWFDTGMDLPLSDFTKEDAAMFDETKTYFKDGLIHNLRSKFSSNLVSKWSSTTTYDVSGVCLNDTEKIFSDLARGELYAKKFLDADGKVPPGVLQGSLNWVGDYQECTGIESLYNNFTGHRFKGSYFSVAFYRNGGPIINGLPILIGICLPSSCYKSDARVLAEVAFAPLSLFNISVGFVVEDVHPPYDGVAIATFVISGIIGTLILLGTAFDMFMVSKEVTDEKLSFFNTEPKYGAVPSNDSQDTEATGLLSKDTVQNRYSYVLLSRDKLIGFFKFLLCFSFIRNTKKLLNTSTATGPLACLNVLRVISMWWVIQGHTYLFTMSVLDNPLYAQRTISERFTFQPILNGTFSVDTFFFLSGLLVAYLALREISEKGRLNWIYFFVHRYWRLTPMYAFLILVLMSLSEHMVSGPFQWIVSDPEHGLMYDIQHDCYDYWWSNLLYINNFYPKYGGGGCFSWAWYLANDMQFYLFISPLLLVMFKIHKNIGAAVSVFLILACIGIRGFLVSWYGIVHGKGATKHTDDPWAKEPLYNRPWARMSVYVIGFLTGFILHHVRCKLRMKRLFVLVGWCLATATALAVVYGLFYYSKHPNTSMSLVATGFYDSLSRTAWGLSLSWVVLACASGHGGLVNWFLSWKVWAPLGRLTYAAYLIHPIILVIYELNLATPLHFTDLTVIYMFVSNLVFSNIAAFIVSMAVEAPMMAIEKLLLKKQA